MMNAKKINAFILIISGAFIGCLWIVKLKATPEVTQEIPDIKTILPQIANTDKKITSNTSIEFIDETFIAGITHRHEQKKDKIASFEDSLGGGVCVADFNNDNWDDIFFIVGSGNRRHFGKEIWWQAPQPNQLYINQSGKYFSNETVESGIKDIGFGIACAAADLNNDGFIDIIVANKGENFIYRNKGNGSFERVRSAFNNSQNYFSTSILIRDVNSDGLDDIIFGNYVIFEQEQNILELNAGFETHNKTNFEPALHDAQPDTLFINEGDFSFTQNEKIIQPNRHGRTLGFFDDGTIISLNDKGSPSEKIYIDKKSTRTNFITVNARDAKIINPPSKKGEPIFVASDAAKGGIYALTLDGSANDKSWDYKINSESRLHNTTWSLLSGDFNNDGYDDIFLSNGSVTPHPDSNTTTTGQPNTLLIADPIAENFEQIKLKNERLLSARGAALVDMNNDGKLDIVINNNNDYPTLLLNNSTLKNTWIGLRCIPTYLCKNSTMSLNGKFLGRAFKTKNNYASQSSSSYIISPIENSEKINISVTSDNRKTNFSIDQHGRYYTINLQEKTIVKINHETSDSSYSVADREEFISLLSRNMNSKRFSELTYKLSFSKKADQLLILQQINTSKNRIGFPLAEKWAASPDEKIAIEAIKALKELEIEESVPTLINLIKSENIAISCAALDAFQFFYWKDEATPERKNWAESEIIKSLTAANQEKAECAINAIAESESYRALVPLLSLLKSENGIIAASAARALGMLRQTSAIDDLKFQVSNSSSPFVRAESLTALIRLNYDATLLTRNDIFKKDDASFNKILTYALHSSDDGVAASTDIRALTQKNEKPNIPLFSNLNYQESIHFYESIKNTSFNLEDESNANLKIKSIKILSSKFLSLQAAEKLYLSLSEKDRLKIIEELSEGKKNIFLEKEIISDSDICNTEKNINFCQKHNSNKKLSASDISNTIIDRLNNGKYTEAKAIANHSNKLENYSLAVNQLLLDNRVQKNEMYFILSNFQIKEDNLDQIGITLLKFSEEEQISILRSISPSFEAKKFSTWVENYASKTTLPAIAFYSYGIGSVTTQEKTND